MTLQNVYENEKNISRVFGLYESLFTLIQEDMPVLFCTQ